MLPEALQLAIAVLAFVALPGILLSYALFPRRGDIGSAERVYVVLAGGIMLLMSLALLLGFMPHGNRGQLQSLPLDGTPNVELGMVVIDLGLA